MKKPILQRILPKNYLQFLKDTYPPAKTAAGEAYDSQLTYITFERSFLKSPVEWELIEEHGFAPLGFLLALRIEMSKTLGYGIALYDNSLAKCLAAIQIDSSIPMETLKLYYNVLLEYGLLFVIEDSEGKQVVANPNQVYNWELKEYTRWYNSERKRISREKAEEKAAATEGVEKEEFSETPEKIPLPTETPPMDGESVWVDGIECISGEEFF